MNRIPLIIDTDVALGVHHEGRPRDIDDGFAIAEAINSPELDLRLVSTVFGNAPLVETYRVAREIVALKQADVPVVAGADKRMETGTASNAAVDAMAELLRHTPCAVAAIGPLTNLGLLAAHHPEAFANITTLIIVAGRSPGRRFYLGDTGPVQDFNFENDVLATTTMLAAASPRTTIVCAGFELTSQICITEQDLQTIAARNTPTAAYFYRNSLDWCRHWTRTFPTDAGFHPWDSAAIAYLKHPDYFTADRRGWRITPRPKGPVWLECDPDAAAKPLTYCTGFAPGGAAAFVRDVVESVY
ncbi:MAG: nucleoside hydrolase [Pseudomonadales bacterium]|nr:nucleoside hydrolase [Pseudomonadales bacterium]